MKTMHSRGGAVIQMLIVIMTIGLAGAMQATLYDTQLDLNRKSAVRYMFRLKQATINSLVGDDDAWLMTLQQQSNPNQFGCLFGNNRQCPNGPTPFSLYDANGVAHIDAANGVGFDLAGNACNGFVANMNQPGNDDCPFRAEVTWQPYNCPSPCFSVLQAGEAYAARPNIQVNIRFLTHGGAGLSGMPSANGAFGKTGPLVRTTNGIFKDYCMALGGTYNPTTQTCDSAQNLGPTKICPSLNYIHGIDAQGNIVCKLTDQISTCARISNMHVANGINPISDWACVITYSYQWVANPWGACISLGTWEPGPWGNCANISCTQAQQTRTMNCLNGSNGQQTRTVICQRNDGLTVADTYCAKLPKPAATQSCVASGCTQPSPPTQQSCPTVGEPCKTVLFSIGFMPSCLPLGYLQTGMGQGANCTVPGTNYPLDWAGSDAWNNSAHTRIPGTGVCPGPDCYCTPGATSVAVRNVYQCQFCPSGNWTTITGRTGVNPIAVNYGNPYGGEVDDPAGNPVYLTPPVLKCQ